MQPLGINHPTFSPGPVWIKAWVTNWLPMAWLSAHYMAPTETLARMEVGLVSPFFTCHGRDWEPEYFSVRKKFNATWMGGVFLMCASYPPTYTNAEVDGKPGCAVSDLLEAHPHNPALQRNILPPESKINQNPLVDSALVFGQRKPYAGVLIQLKSNIPLPSRGEVLDAVW
ncbi:hypothetical protein C8R43DRAFT_952102 [Mycena crocata]|nr:hypothetical protein C8R43DRAFT_952102 [Mycena crocata]